ncbi:hypothetical protein I0Q91_05490 [Halanaerobiaceae bacterium Z-7014]|uniref:Uncharacterized protein n=1 Tax=Halonatronomonas betaini TaxID=2778430 RepID=A0A931ARH7_9FIRM|nr:hypothetical protein [Halonatronomonas betaini]MBF8436521.1 hypothetical protein [Halonatronomonas betaini]
MGQESREAGRELCIYGPDDEVGELIGNILSEEDMAYSRLVNIEKIETDDGVAILYWLPDNRLS